jgi:hypothetical protein
MIKKRYPSCGVEKPYEEWPNNRASKTGLHSCCKKCHYQRQAAKSQAYKMFHRSKSRARAKGLEHTITIEDIKIPTHCPLLGIPLQDNTGQGKGNNPTSPSLDRLDSSKGYTPDNIWVISNRANEIKSNATLEELEQIVCGLRAKIKGSF